MSEIVEVQCVHCGKSVNAPDGELRVNKPSRPGSFWVDTNDGRRIVLCFPCSWNSETAKKYPRLQYKKQRFSKSAVAVSRHRDIQRKETQAAQKTSGGLVAFLSILALTILVVISSVNSDENPPVNDGYVDEWNADNSIDGPAGTFDDQSKP